MALIWSREVDGKRYEVRGAGRTRRLYTDGVLHSEVNARRTFTGHVWDLLSLPALFRPRGTIDRALVLGVGGGAVLRQLDVLASPTEMVGVELDPVHLGLARRFFGVTPDLARLERAEAGEWVRGYRGPRFDLIVEDLFTEADGEPVRALPASGRWILTLARLLSPDGVLVMNFDSPRTLRRSGFFTHRRVAGRFANAFEVRGPRDENAVGVFLRAPGNGRTLRRRLRVASRGGGGQQGPPPVFRLRALTGAQDQATRD